MCGICNAFLEVGSGIYEAVKNDLGTMQLSAAYKECYKDFSVKRHE